MSKSTDQKITAERPPVMTRPFSLFNIERDGYIYEIKIGQYGYAYACRLIGHIRRLMRRRLKSTLEKEIHALDD